MNIDFGSINIAVTLVALVVAVTLHEAMHAYTAHWLGDDTAHEHGRLSLNPLRHVDPFTTILLPLVTLVLFKIPLLAAKPVPFNPHRVRHGEYGAALIGLAGPFTNLFLALVTAGILHLTAGSVSGLPLQFLVAFFGLNVALFVFNMIPIPPLDGSRAIYALAPESMQEVMASLERYGILIIFTLVLAVPAFSTVLVNVNNAIIHALL